MPAHQVFCHDGNKRQPSRRLASTATKTGGTAAAFLEKAGYGVGDIGFKLLLGQHLGILLIFYTDVFGISAAAAGTMMLITKIIDAFTDPMMGAIADRTRTRFGKFRPYCYGWHCHWPAPAS